MSSPDTPPSVTSQHPLPYEQAVARTATAPRGGWTGFWVGAWAAVVGLSAALVAAGLVLLHAMLDVVELVTVRFAMEQQLPQGALEDPTAKLTDAAGVVVGHVQIWVWIATTICILLIVTALRLSAGSEGGRKSSRLLLALLVGNLIAASAYVWLTLVPALAARSELLRAAITDLARGMGEPVDTGLLDTIFDPTWMSVAAWAPALLIGGPTLLLWWAAGRRSLRTWCTQALGTTTS